MITNKKTLMSIIFGQYDEARKTKIALGENFNADCQAGNLIELLKRVHIVCFGSNDRGLSFGLCKQVVANKSMNNYSNKKPHEPHGFKEEVKIKYNAVKTVNGRFPNGTGVMMEFLRAVVPPIGWAGYCQLTPAKKVKWEERGDNLNKSMLFL